VSDTFAPWLNLGEKIRTRIGTTGASELTSIPEDLTFLQWCNGLAASGLKVDGIPFTLDDRPSLRPLYEAVPTTVEEARRQTLVLMKAAQMGATTWQMLAVVYMTLKFSPVVIGAFLPDQATAGDISERRFMRIVRTIPEAYQRLITRVAPDGSLLKVGEGNILTRIMQESAVLFLWTSGKLTTESRPMDVVTYDEVQGMSLEEIDRVYERMSASRIRFRLMLSTSNVPEMDIDFWYKHGTRSAWHVECQHCNAMSDLSQFWPECCVYNLGQIADAPMLDWVYVCPECASWIQDTQRGRYIAANPDASVKSWHVSQIQSPMITARDMAEAWNRAVTGDQRKTFYNRKLGLPYIDKEQLPVTMADCLACVQDGLALGLTWQQGGSDTYMGVDQMGGYNAVIIKRRLPDNRQAVVHVEAVFDINPFERCGQLMRDFGVSMCCVEQLPNVNDARRFANEFRGRVYLGWYSGADTDMYTWGDMATRSDRKTSEEDRTRFTVALQQYKAMQASLFRIKNRHCLFPDPALLEQEVIERGERKRINLVRDWVFGHFCKTALVVEQDEETRKPKPKVVKLGIDPHFSFANMLCDTAWARIHGASSFIMPQGLEGFDPPKTPAAQQMERDMPGLPRNVLAMVDAQPPSTCGRCMNASADGRRCELRLLGISSSDASCDLYEPRKS
jgi:hypothetical protein